MRDFNIPSFLIFVKYFFSKKKSIKIIFVPSNKVALNCDYLEAFLIL